MCFQSRLEWREIAITANRFPFSSVVVRGRCMPIMVFFMNSDHTHPDQNSGIS
jgi:hypothetical protein